MRTIAHLTAAIGILVGAGCGGRYEVALEDGGFVNRVVGYRIGPSKTFDAGRTTGEWVVDNFTPEGDLKRGPEYTTLAFIDLDGDGRREARRTLPLYDLRLENRRTGARIWSRMLPIDRSMGRRELAGLVRDFIDGVAGAGSVAVQPLGEGAHLVLERRYATKTLDQAPLKVGGLPAHGATFSVYNVDQQQVEAGRAEETVRIVLVKTGRRWPSNAALNVNAAATDPDGSRFPALILLQMASRPEDFEATAAAFRELVWSFSLTPMEGYPSVPPEVARTWPPEWIAPTGPGPSAPPPATSTPPSEPAPAEPSPSPPAAFSPLPPNE